MYYINLIHIYIPIITIFHTSCFIISGDAQVPSQSRPCGGGRIGRSDCTRYLITQRLYNVCAVRTSTDTSTIDKERGNLAASEENRE